MVYWDTGFACHLFLSILIYLSSIVKLLLHTNYINQIRHLIADGIYHQSKGGQMERKVITH